MKNYLLMFRDQAFTASFQLYKRTMFNILIAYVLFFVVHLFTTTPLLLKSIGLEFSDYLGYFRNISEMSQEINENKENPQAMLSIISSYFTINYAYFLFYFILSLLMYSWSINYYYTICDNEVRLGKPSFIKAFRDSFNSKVFKILSYNILYFLLTVALFILFGFIFTLISSLLSFFGIVLGFIAFFFVVVFILRCSIGYAAIVHGNMNATQAMSYSLTNINWKRGWMLFLMGIMLVLALGLASELLKLFVKIDPENISYMSLIPTMLISMLVNGLFFPFLFAATSTLYFRYSDDQDGDSDDDLHVHLVDQP